MPGFRGLILDLDGTVLDSHSFTFAAFRAACAPWREPPTDAQVFAAFGPSERIILQGLLQPEQVEPAYGRLQAYYVEHAAGVGLHPQMRPLLHDCKQAGKRLGLFTGRGGDSTRMLLAKLDLEWAFDAVVAGDEVQRPKPAPDGVLQLLGALRCQKSESLVVGDSRLDLEAASAAGVASVFAAWHPWEGMSPPSGAELLTEPDELRSMLALLPSSPASES